MSMAMDTTVIATGAASLIALLLIWSLRTKSSGLPLPPGPRRIPFFGNIFIVDIVKPHLTYTRWKHQYGDIVYSQLLGRDYIIINSEKVARTLSDAQHSAVYADRPILPIYKLFGAEAGTGFLGYGNTWKLHRKLFHQTLRPDATVKYHDLHMDTATSLVRNLIEDGAALKLESILMTFAAANVLAVAYGYNIKSLDHPVIKLVQEYNHIALSAATPERAALLDIFPFIEYLPSWIPGLGFLGRAAISRKLAFKVRDEPFEYTRSEVAAGTAPASMVADFLSNQQEQEDENGESYKELEMAMKETAATVYIAGAETSAAILSTFVLAMVLFPEVQDKARAEIESVVGKDRLPTFDDRDSLPYIEAVISETMRWYPPVPLCVPHATTMDDEVQGYHIPKGSIVLFNAWAMSRDYDDPDQFRPERHILPNGELSPTAKMIMNPSFGFGRRVCPGRFSADSALWAGFVQVLGAVRFSKAKDADGRPIEVNPTYTTGLTTQPSGFPFAIDKTERTHLIYK